ncbi:MAG: sulfatase [Bacteroidales bacterium]|nr:sulfatase [Bacteroidales bacterium]
MSPDFKNLRNSFTWAGLVLNFAVSAQYGGQRPNFVLIIADDVSFDDIGCYGNSQVKTPNIDRLASSGIRFTNMFLTASSSSPSRNSIITGRYPHNTGGAELHTEPPDHMVSFPEILKSKGYYTAQAGKFHMGPYARRGFDSINENGKLNGDGGEDLWVRCLRDRPRDKPFFMWFAAMDAHRIWGPNEFSGTHDPAGLTPPFYLAQGERTRADLASYYDEIARLDHFTGLVAEELKRQGVAGNTVVIIMADNGRPFPHSKTRVNDRGLKTPFILCWPSGTGTLPAVCNSLLSSVDIAPTILQLASQDIPETMQGIGFASLLKDPSKELRTYVFAEHNWHDYEAHERMVRSRDYLYIQNSRPAFPQLGPADAVGSLSFAELDSLRKSGLLTETQRDIFIAPRPAEELYDCNADPFQFRNLAGGKEYRKEFEKMKAVLAEWMQETGDNIPSELTKDWYERAPGYIKTGSFNIRGEQVDEKYSATKINKKGPY